jgi:hypothetical protein
MLAMSASPAFADDPADEAIGGSPDITFSAPSPAANAVLAGPQTIVVRANADEFTPLKAFRVSILSDDPAIPAFSHVITAADFDETSPQTIKFDWDTSQLTPFNGTYKVVAYGKACDFNDCAFDISENAVTLGGLKVNNAPAVVQGVQATMQDATPVISWSPAKEPDVKKYAVIRTLPGQQPQLAGVVSSTSFSDSCKDPMPCPAGTTMTYQIAAIRNSPASPAGVNSLPSAAVTATTAGAPAAPAPKAAAPVKIVLPAPMSDRYEAALPYKMPAPAPQVAPEAPAAPDPVTVAAPVDTPADSPVAARGIITTRLEQPRVPKVRYVAGSLMLLVLAMLVARGGGLLLGASPRERR